MDIKSKEKRSLNMSHIRYRDTKPELCIRSLLYRCGFRYRVNYSIIEGKPDLYFQKKKVAVFVHGCFWHRHKDCPFSYKPKTNVVFWEQKFRNNREHDQQVVRDLNNENIRVLIIWECTTKKMVHDQKYCECCLAEIVAFINNSEANYLEI